MFDFAPEEQGELKMQKGDIIVVKKKTDANWWEGTNTRTKMDGMFPVPYIQQN